MANKKLVVFAIPAGFIFILLGGLFFWALGNDPRHLPSQLIDQPVPPFKVASLTDPEHFYTEKDLFGEISLINVWGTWCPSCYDEHPFLVKLQQEQGIKIFGFNYKDQRSKALAYLQQYGDPYAVNIFDQQGRLAIDFGVYGAPETFLLDEYGHVRYRHVGTLTEDVWENNFLPLVELLEKGF